MNDLNHINVKPISKQVYSEQVHQPSRHNQEDEGCCGGFWPSRKVVYLVGTAALVGFGVAAAVASIWLTAGAAALIFLVGLAIVATATPLAAAVAPAGPPHDEKIEIAKFAQNIIERGKKAENYLTEDSASSFKDDPSFYHDLSKVEPELTNQPQQENVQTSQKESILDRIPVDRVSQISNLGSPIDNGSNPNTARSRSSSGSQQFMSTSSTTGTITTSGSSTDTDSPSNSPINETAPNLQNTGQKYARVWENILKLNLEPKMAYLDYHHTSENEESFMKDYLIEKKKYEDKIEMLALETEILKLEENLRLWNPKKEKLEAEQKKNATEKMFYQGYLPAKEETQLSELTKQIENAENKIKNAKKRQDQLDKQLPGFSGSNSQSSSPSLSGSQEISNASTSPMQTSGSNSPSPRVSDGEESSETLHVIQTTFNRGKKHLNTASTEQKNNKRVSMLENEPENLIEQIAKLIPIDPTKDKMDLESLIPRLENELENLRAQEAKLVEIKNSSRIDKMDLKNLNAKIVDVDTILKKTKIRAKEKDLHDAMAFLDDHSKSFKQKS